MSKFGNIGAQQQARTFDKAYFGRLDINPVYQYWQNGRPSPVDEDQWNKLGDSEKSLALEFTVQVKDLDPGAPYEATTRQVTVGSPDWKITFLPSVAAIFGEEAIGPDMIDNTIEKLLDGKYVETVDKPQQPRKNQPADGKTYSTIAIARVFESREACDAARIERYGNRSESTGESTGSAPAANDAFEAFDDLAPDGMAIGDWRAYVEAICDYDADAKPASIAADLGLEPGAVIRVRTRAKEVIPF